MKISIFSPKAIIVLLACMALALSGCASRPANPDDPLERYNRAAFAFNDGVDTVVLRPAAKAYDAVTPGFVRTAVGNFFSNLEDLWIGLNNILQGKVGDGMSDWMRFAVNTTFGLAGVLDIASEAGMPKHDEDFGQTLAVWGVGEGPYFVVPLLGPRTLRDASVIPIDSYGNGLSAVDHVPTKNTLRWLRVVHNRAGLLGFDKTIEEAATDKYAFVRDSYLQQRRYKVYDGNPPIEYEDFENGTAAILYESAPDALAVSAVERLELVSLTEIDIEMTGFIIR